MNGSFSWGPKQRSSKLLAMAACGTGLPAARRSGARETVGREEKRGAKGNSSGGSPAAKDHGVVRNRSWQQQRRSAPWSGRFGSRLAMRRGGVGVARRGEARGDEGLHQRVTTLGLRRSRSQRRERYDGGDRTIRWWRPDEDRSSPRVFLTSLTSWALHDTRLAYI